MLNYALGEDLSLTSMCTCQHWTLDYMHTQYYICLYSKSVNFCGQKKKVMSRLRHIGFVRYKIYRFILFIRCTKKPQPSQRFRGTTSGIQTSPRHPLRFLFQSDLMGGCINSMTFLHVMITYFSLLTWFNATSLPWNNHHLVRFRKKCHDWAWITT